MKRGTTYLPSVIIDNGSKFCKAGLAGDEAPPVQFETIIGRPKYRSVMLTNIPIKDFYVGEETRPRCRLLNLSFPIQNSMFTNWEDMERIWFHCYYNELRIHPEEQPCLLTEAPLTPKANREKMTQVMFETFTVPKFHVGNQAVLSLYASGRTTGLVIDSGHDISYAVPVSEGYALSDATQKIELAGKDITNYLSKLLDEIGIQFTSSVDVGDIKEKTCFVALDFEKAMKESERDSTHNVVYELPDGKSITVGSQGFKAAEILFNPSLIGKECSSIHELAFDSLMKCDVDLRRDLYQNICLSGGTSMMKGFPERFTKQLISLVPSTANVKVIAPTERKFSAWIGGSILTSLSTFQPMWITQVEYDEIGPSIVHRKYFTTKLSEWAKCSDEVK